MVQPRLFKSLKMSVEWNDFYFDFSKNRIDKTGIDLLLELANNCGLKPGNCINEIWRKNKCY